MDFIHKFILPHSLDIFSSSLLLLHQSCIIHSEALPGFRNYILRLLDHHALPVIMSFGAMFIAIFLVGVVEPFVSEVITQSPDQILGSDKSSALAWLERKILD